MQIPTLREVLEQVKPGGMEVNIELKTGIYWYPGLEEKTVELVKAAGMENRVIYSSFNHYSVQKYWNWMRRQKRPISTAMYC